MRGFQRSFSHPHIPPSAPRVGEKGGTGEGEKAPGVLCGQVLRETSISKVGAASKCYCAEVLLTVPALLITQRRDWIEPRRPVSRV